MIVQSKEMMNRWPVHRFGLGIEDSRPAVISHFSKP
jgi:hypothetical protein